LFHLHDITFFLDYYSCMTTAHALYMQKWRRKNPEKVAVYDKQYQKDNMPKKLAGNRSWYHRNKERLQKARRARIASLSEEARRALRARNTALSKKYKLKKFGLTEGSFAALLKEQGGVCAICKGSNKRGRLAVDHCHKTGRVRGLLCHRCNRAIGAFEDDPALLRAAITYLSGRLR
jgi:Recombination endonuclease VII